MPTTTNPNRTTSVIGTETRSGVRCENCNWTYAACTDRIHGGRSACCGVCADTDTHDVEVVESPPPVTVPNSGQREVRQNAMRVIHKTVAPAGRQHNVETVCGGNLLTTVADARRWRGGTANSTLTECTVCFNPVMADPEVDDVLIDDDEDPTPTQPREVRENGVATVHLTYDGGSSVTTVCGQHPTWLVADPRRWIGSPPVEVQECTECFAASRTPRPEVGTDVPTAEVRSNANPVVHRTTDVDNATRRRYPLVSICGETMTYAVRDPRVWNGHPRRDITECPTCFGAVVPPQPVPPVVHPLQLCSHTGHIGEPHTHTTGRDPLWGRPGRNSTGRDRVTHEDGTEVQFANARHIARAVPNSGQTTTTERESTTVTETTHRFPVGTDIYPIDGDKLRDLPPGSVLTIRSRDRGELRGGSLHFGCQEWTMEALARAQATVEFQPSARIVATCDVATVRDETGLVIAGRRQGLGDVNEYARSIIVKELAEVVVANAIVMEHGFYGCVHHADHVIVIGNGRERNRGAVVPLVGQIRRESTATNALTGTVGLREGLLHTSMRNCTPVFSGTSAFTMNFAAERRYSLVPATTEQIERTRRHNSGLVVRTGHLDEGQGAVVCSIDGTVTPAEPDPF